MKVKILYMFLIGVTILGLTGIINAYSGTAKVVVEGNYIEAFGGDGELGGATNFDYVDTDNGYYVDGTQIIDGSGNFDGAVTGTTGTFSSTLSVTGALTVSGETVVEGFTDGAGGLAIATTSATRTLTQAELLADNLIEITFNTGTTATLTFPATSTMTTLIPTEGDHRSWLIHNATSSTMAVTLTAGTGMDLIGVTTNDDVIDETEYSEFECWRKIDTDVTCRISELLHVD